MSFARRIATVAALSAVVAGAAGVAHADGNAAHGKELAYTCLGCHAIEDYKNVYPTYSVPMLRGQNAAYIVAALQGYRSGERSHGTMHAQAASLSEQDIQDIAAYLGSDPLKASGNPPAAEPAGGPVCVACHGSEGVAMLPGIRICRPARRLPSVRSGIQEGRARIRSWRLADPDVRRHQGIADTTAGGRARDRPRGRRFSAR